MSFLQTLFATTLVKAVRALPLTVCFRLGQFLGLLAYMVLPPYRKLARQNLRIAFGTSLTSRDCRRLACKNFLLLGANMLCSLKIPTLSEEALRKLATIENEDEEHWKSTLNLHTGRGTVVALSHFGNWEINAQLASLVKPRRAGAVYQPLRNKALDDLINSDRRSRGVATFDRKRDLPAAATLLREGGLVGVLIDQHAGDAGIWIPFFNKLASTSPLAATLAQRTGSLLVQVTIRTSGLARWAIRIHAPIPTEGRTTAEITYDLGCQLAGAIQESPADWFWMHNRWKLPYPAFLLSRVKRGLYVPHDVTLKKFNLLVRSPNWLGDACMAAPSVLSLKSGRPDLRLTILAPVKLADLWRAFPEVDEVIEISPKSSPWQVARLLRQKATTEDLPAFDAALLLPNSVRSALEVWLAGIPRRIGRVGKKGFWRSWLINQPVPEASTEPSTHQSEEYEAIARWLGR